MYLEYAEEPFGLSVHTFDKVGLVTKGEVIAGACEGQLS
jgi:hypothetical protein